MAGSTITVANKCMVCNGDSTMTVDRESYFKWRKGMFIQNAFPNLSADQREQLMTGTHGKCFDNMFADSED